MSLLNTLLYPAPTRNHTPLPATGRAGRNLPAAVGVAAILIIFVLATVLVYKVAFVFFAIAAICGALWELAGAFARKGIRLPLAPLWVGTIGTLTCAWRIGAEAAMGAYIATVGACVLWSFLEQAEADTGTEKEAVVTAAHPATFSHEEARQSRSRAASASVFAATYLPFLASFAIVLLAQSDGAAKVLTLIALPVANDTGGWLAGITFGKHPMAPSVSPKKSWEGFAGSMLLTIAAGIGAFWYLSAPLWGGALLGATIVVVSTLGDLSESLLKRDLGLKDMGTLLPGHGGIMDRLDSILVAAPVVYIASLLMS